MTTATLNVPYLTTCMECRKETDFQFVEDQETLQVGEESITVDVEYYRCTECDYQWEESHPDYHPIQDAYDEYERRTGKKWVGVYKPNIPMEQQINNLVSALNNARTATRDLIVESTHVMGDGHDSENFRSCTHQDCVALRVYFRKYGL